MRLLCISFICLLICPRILEASTSQLYTGDAVTVPPGVIQLQGYFDSSFGGPQRVAGASATFGATKRLDVKLGYGYLWNNIGPDVKLGPNVGFKWRFLGDGLRKPSAAFSSLYAINGSGSKSSKSDFGGLLIFQYPAKPFIFLANLGRVWVGDNNAPDLGYFAFAAARGVSSRTLVALEYSYLERLTSSPRFRPNEQIAAGIVYSPSQEWGYSAQLGYLPLSRTNHLHLTLGATVYF